MEVKSFCQVNLLEVKNPVTSLESLTLAFTNQPTQMEYLSLALVNLFGLYPSVKYLKLSQIPLNLESSLIHLVDYAKGNSKLKTLELKNNMYYNEDFKPLILS